MSHRTCSRAAWLRDNEQHHPFSHGVQLQLFPSLDAHPKPSRSSLLGRTYIALCLNPLVRPQTLSPGSDVGALSSVDQTSTWTTISGPGNGLPTMPHCIDLVFNAEQTGAHWLCLGTYSWSAWRTLLSAPFPSNPVDAFVNGEMSLQVTQAVDEKLKFTHFAREVFARFLEPVRGVGGDESI